jgi:hypothetical protein
VFPERARLDNVTVIVRDPAHDFIAENVSLGLNPRVPGALSVTLLQLPTGEAWTGVTGTTSYDKRNLALRDVVLNEQTRFSLINADASRIREHMIALRLVGTLDGAPIDLQASLTEQARSLFIKSHTTAHNLSLSSAKKLGLFSDAPVQGNVEKFTFDFVGLLGAPKTWAASGDGVVRDLQVAGATFDRAAAQISAHDGVAAIQPVELTRAGTALQVHGTVQLPEHADDLGAVRRSLRLLVTISISAHNLRDGKPLSGHAQINGTLEIRDEQLQAGFHVASGPVSSGDFSLEKFEVTGTAEKNLRLHSKDEPWFEGLHANATAVASAVRNSEFAVDTISGQLDQNGSLVTISNVKVQRGSNQIVSNASVRLRAEEKNFIKQPATIQVAIDAPETADFWNGNSPNRVSGTLNASGIVQWNGATADGWFNVYGSKLQIRNLSVPQLSGAGSIWQSRIFLDDLTANLNQRDFVNGQGTLDLRARRNSPANSWLILPT